MTRVIYQGKAGIRILGAADLEKAGVEGFRQTTFERGIAKEIDEVAAEAILKDELGLFAGAFVEAPPMKKVGSTKGADDSEDDDEELIESAKDAGKNASTSTPSSTKGSGTAGNGSSTKSAPTS